MVYVTNRQGKALMPTDRHGKVRRLLKSGLAHVVHRMPFTIQLDYDTTEITQPITLGIDAGLIKRESHFQKTFTKGQE